MAFASAEESSKTAAEAALVFAATEHEKGETENDGATEAKLLHTYIPCRAPASNERQQEEHTTEHENEKKQRQSTYLADVSVVATACSTEQVLRVELEVLVHGAGAVLLAAKIRLLQTTA